MSAILTLETNECDSTVEFMANRDGTLYITLNQPWAGDSESGFGFELCCLLTPAQVQELKVWLTRMLP